MASLTTRMFGFLKNAIIGILTVTTLAYLSMFVYNRVLKLRSLKAGKPKPEPAVLTDFDAADAVSFSPVPGVVTDLTSDRTLDALLSGALGPAVVLVYAEWCPHCTNMVDAFESAAKQSFRIPFVRIEGRHAPVCLNRHSIAGYPTVFGVAANGSTSRFAGDRTTSNLVKFAKSLLPAEIALPQAGMANTAAETADTAIDVHEAHEVHEVHEVNPLLDDVPNSIELVH